METNIEKSSCGCPETKSLQQSNKYYHEIGAEAIGNQLLVRVEKDRSKMKRISSEWDPPCHCKPIPEIIRPTRTQGLRIVNIDKNNQIIFKINPRSQFNCQNSDYQPQKSRNHPYKNQKPALTVYPELEDSGLQEVYQNHEKIGNHNMFMMKIEKKPSAKEQKNRNIELEVIYPRLPPRILTPPPTPPQLPPMQPALESTPEIDAPILSNVQPVKSKKVKKGEKKKKKKKKKEQKKKKKT